MLWSYLNRNRKQNYVAETNNANWKDIYTLPLTTVYDASWKTSQVYLQINSYIGVNLKNQAYVISAIVYRNNRILILGMCDNSEFMEPIGKLQQKQK